MHILFVTSNRLGDAVLSTGLLDHLIRTYPDARITVACGPVAEGVFAHMPNRDRTIVLRKQPCGRHWLPLWADVALHAMGSGGRYPRVGAVLAGADAPARGVPPDRRTEDRAAWCHPRLVAAAAAGCVDERSGPTPRVRFAADRTDRSVALAPTANWAAEGMAGGSLRGVFRSLPSTVARTRSRWCWLAPGPSERAMAAPLLAALPEAVDLVGAVSLPEAAAVLQRAALFIGNDSGLMHLSAAAGAPTIGLFGPTDAATYRPAGRCATAVVAASMDAISVRQVVEAAEMLLA